MCVNLICCYLAFPPVFLLSEDPRVKEIPRVLCSVFIFRSSSWPQRDLKTPKQGSLLIVWNFYLVVGALESTSRYALRCEKNKMFHSFLLQQTGTESKALQP